MPDLVISILPFKVATTMVFAVFFCFDFFALLMLHIGVKPIDK